MPEHGERGEPPVERGETKDAPSSPIDPKEKPASLDQLLDEALNDFELPSSRSAGQATREKTTASTSSAGEVQKFDPLRKGPSKQLKKAAKGMEFNPLPERARKAAASSQASGQLDRKPGATFGAVPPDVLDMDEELKKGLEQLMKELAEVDLSEQQQQAPGGGGGGGARTGSQFADTLRALSETQATLRQASGIPGPAGPGSAAGSFSDPIFAGLQEQLSRGGGGEEALGGFADGIMRQLLSKEVLQQPMRDIGERYPAWLDAHRDALPSEKLEKFEAQYQHIQTILHIYETDPDNFSELFSALQQMQACGQPPQDIVNDLAPGMSFDEDGLPKLPSPLEGGLGCTIQ